MPEPPWEPPAGPAAEVLSEVEPGPGGIASEPPTAAEPEQQIADRSQAPQPLDPADGRGGRERPVSDAESPVDLARVAWLLTVATLLAGTVILAIRGDVGYAIVAAVVAASAAINVI